MNVIDRHAITRGAAIGLLLLVPISAFPVIVYDNIHDFEHGAWAPVFWLATLVVYGVAGFIAGRIAIDAPYSNGIVAAIGSFVLWLPLRAVIRALRDSGQGLFAGLTPARILGQVVFAAAFGAIGGVIAARRARVDSGTVDG